MVDSTEYAVAYGSAALNPSKKVYCTTRKELLAIVKFVRQFRHYLLGKHFKIRTDHHSFARLLHFKQADGQLARWLEEVSQYDFTIEYRPGKEHSNADFLSRFGSECPSVGEALKGLPCRGCSACHRAARKWLSFSEEVDDTIPLSRIRNVKLRPEEPNWCSPFPIKDVARWQSEDDGLALVHAWLEGDTFPSESELALEGKTSKFYWGLRAQLALRNGVIYCNTGDSQTS